GAVAASGRGRRPEGSSSWGSRDVCQDWDPDNGTEDRKSTRAFRNTHLSTGDQCTQGGGWMYGSRGVGAFAGRRASAAVLGAALLITGCSSDGDGKGDDPEAAGAGISQQPKETDPYWVNPDGTAAREVAALTKAGKKAEAEQVR